MPKCKPPKNNSMSELVDSLIELQKSHDNLFKPYTYSYSSPNSTPTMEVYNACYNYVALRPDSQSIFTTHNKLLEILQNVIDDIKEEMEQKNEKL